ncbi:MAG: hypothetical protein RIR39_697 [Pseudomonadota bacterium]
MNLNSLLYISAFSPKSLQDPNAWIGHLPFAAWLIKEVTPKVFVELGTHSGNSYFSFCQSVVENDLPTKCYAVDTWEGDEHAGHYNDEVFIKVNAHHQEHYAEVSSLLRMTFNDAAKTFADASIELLHIDGLHTYEAVLHDFETWLPKLAPGAVVLFHDTDVREHDFGVWKLWKELQANYPDHLEFIHSNGLGVLQLNHAPDDKKLGWLQPESPDKTLLINYFTVLGSRQLERFELKELNSHLYTKKTEWAARGAVITQLEQALADIGSDWTARGAVISQLEQDLTNIGSDWTARGAVITQLEQALANIGTDWTARGAVITQLEQALADQSDFIETELIKYQNTFYGKCCSGLSRIYALFSNKKTLS